MLFLQDEQHKSMGLIKMSHIDEMSLIDLQEYTKALEARCDVLEKELLEEARLNGMGMEREASLLSKIESLKKNSDYYCQKCKYEIEDELNGDLSEPFPEVNKE